MRTRDFLHAYFSQVCKSPAGKHAAKPEVRVRIRRVVVQVHVERARVRIIVPVTTADNRAGRSALRLLRLRPLSFVNMFPTLILAVKRDEALSFATRQMIVVPLLVCLL